MSNEQANDNQTVSTEVEQTGATVESKPEITSPTGNAQSKEQTTTSTPVGQEVFNPQKRYEDLEKNFKELQRFSTQTAQERA